MECVAGTEAVSNTLRVMAFKYDLCCYLDESECAMIAAYTPVEKAFIIPVLSSEKNPENPAVNNGGFLSLSLTL